jgi:hypothetical protein
LPASAEAADRSECVLSDSEYVDELEELDAEEDELDVDVDVEVEVDVDVDVELLDDGVELLEDGVPPVVTVKVAVTTETTLDVSVTAWVIVCVPALSWLESYGLAAVAGPPLKS